MMPLVQLGHFVLCPFYYLVCFEAHLGVPYLARDTTIGPGLAGSLVVTVLLSLKALRALKWLRDVHPEACRSPNFQDTETLSLQGDQDLPG